LKLRKYYGKLLENITIESAGAEGNCIARWNDRVVFVKGAVPGDICDLKIVGKKKKFLIAEIETLHEAGSERVSPFCDHFGTCGGCKWQQMDYQGQLKFKTKQVFDALTRIGKVDIPEVPLALGSGETTHYRNKMEYAFSHSRWLTKEQINSDEFVVEPGLGFHVPKRFDKIVHIEKCHLQDEVGNDIRNWCYAYALEHNFEFYDARAKTGFVRNIMMRNTKSGEWMVLLTFGEDRNVEIEDMLTAIQQDFPQIKSLVFAINEKVNDSIYDLDIRTFYGQDYLEESLGDIKFKIRPKSFFQTNPKQAETLYDVALEFAQLNGGETVYDLYCGTGTISLYLAQKAGKVIGVESVPQAIEDAKENADANNIDNCSFVVGDMKDVFNDEFISTHANPDIIVTDPPRAGMHADVVAQILKLRAPKVVYVSCNPATQARDLALLDEAYKVTAVQPVDMFPHTHHVENVVLLELK